MKRFLLCTLLKTHKYQPTNLQMWISTKFNFRCKLCGKLTKSIKGK